MHSLFHKLIHRLICSYIVERSTLAKMICIALWFS